MENTEQEREVNFLCMQREIFFIFYFTLNV